MKDFHGFSYAGNSADSRIIIEGIDIKEYQAKYCCRQRLFCKKKIKFGPYRFQYIRLNGGNNVLLFAEKVRGARQDFYEINAELKEFVNKIWKPDFSLNWEVEKSLKEKLGFLCTDYNFNFTSFEFEKLLDENGRFWFYGPVYVYCFYRDNICINIVELVQRQDLWIKITDECRKDIRYIEGGLADKKNNIYNLEQYAAALRSEASTKRTIYGIKIN